MGGRSGVLRQKLFGQRSWNLSCFFQVENHTAMASYAGALSADTRSSLPAAVFSTPGRPKHRIEPLNGPPCAKLKYSFVELFLFPPRHIRHPVKGEGKIAGYQRSSGIALALGASGLSFGLPTGSLGIHGNW